MNTWMRRKTFGLSLSVVGGVAALVLTSSETFAKTGSYTIAGPATLPTGPPSTQIRITAKAENGTTYDQVHTVGGNTPEQARNIILTDLVNAGWVATANGTNGIIISGFNLGGGKWSDIKEVDIGDNKPLVDTSADGNITISEATPGDKKFKFLASLPNADAVNPGTIVLNLDTVVASVVSAPLAAGDTPAQAALKLQTALNTAGYVATLSGAEVTLDWNNATNASLLVSPVELVIGLQGGGAGPHLTMSLPDVILGCCFVAPKAQLHITSKANCDGISGVWNSDPDVCVPTVSAWGVAVLMLLVLTAGTIVVMRRRAAVTG